MIKPIDDFIERFQSEIRLDEKLMVRKQNRYFLLNESLKRLVSKDFFYAGIYIGKVKDERFFPSFNLLSIIARGKANKVVVDDKTEWLFICGRDVFRQGIVKTMGSKSKSDHTLVLNRHDECLGFGRITRNLDEAGAIIENVSDIGDFLRRESLKKK
jgi:ribosome biogenesis protein Nip4